MEEKEQDCSTDEADFCSICKKKCLKGLSRKSRKNHLRQHKRKRKADFRQTDS